VGCEKATQAAVWQDEEDGFYNCPIKFIPKYCYDFITEYDAYKNRWARPLEYGQYPNRFIEAVQMYEYYYNQYKDEQQKKTPAGAMENALNAFEGE
jgi:hypothetical protein